MNGFKKRILNLLGRIAQFAIPQVFEETMDAIEKKQQPSTTITQTRKTLTNTKTTKKTKGDGL
jgi:hypothetical protein